MAVRNITQIIADVRRELDEIQVNPSGFAAGTDNADLDVIIRAHIGKAIEFCYIHADLSLLTPNVYFDEGDAEIEPANGIIKYNIPAGDINVAHFDLDDSQPEYENTKFLRLCYARCSSWSRDVVEPVYWTDAAAAKLRNWLTTGTPDRPVVYVWRNAEDGHMMADLYTVGSGDIIEVAIIRKPDFVISAEDTVDLDTRVYDAIVMYAAGLTLVTLKDEHADALLNQALVLMGAQRDKDNG